MQILFHRQFPFIPKRRYFFALSTVAVCLACLATWKIGINYGIDFRGGVKLAVHIAPDTTEGQVAALLEQARLPGSVQRLGEPAQHRFLIKLTQLAAAPAAEGEAAGGESTKAVVEAVARALEAAFTAGAVTIEGQETVGPRVGKELRLRGQQALLFTLIALLIYIGLRFDFYFAPGAIVALIHDVLFTLGALVIAHREFDLTILAALLTIVGYSNNDTIIIYDRIREHGREITADNIEGVVNRAINEMLSRAIITHLTVFFVVMILYLTTHGVIKNFAFAFIFGVIAGAYSSIFIASPIYIWLYRRFPQWRKA